MKISIAALGAICMLALSGCTEEQQNRLSRVGVTWLEGDGVDDSASVFHGKHMRNGWKNSGLPSV